MTTQKENPTHETHPDILKRLQRASGHLATVIAMMKEGRPCAEIAQQLHAVERAITTAKKTLIHDHLDHCLSQPPSGGGTDARNWLGEIKDMAKYL